MSSGLPVELWDAVVSFLPKADQCTCLLLCSALHDIALAYVFRRVDLFLGTWPAAQDPIQLDSHALNRLYVPPDSMEDSYRRNKVSMNILGRISRDPHFAGLVRVMNVGVFVTKYSAIDRDATNALIRGLRCLTSLESFFFYGHYPPTDIGPLDALAAGSAHTLRHLRVPAEWNIDPERLNSTFTLESLLVGRIRDANLDPYPIPPDSNLAKSRATILALGLAHVGTLRRLRVPDLTWLDPGSLSGLTELELTYLHGRELDTGLILTHFPRLRSLVLVSVECHHVEPLAAQPDALPLLHSFDVSSRYRVPVALFGEFILAKKHLRRLNVMTCDESLHLLDLLPRLSGLEVLGLDLWDWNWTVEHHEKLDGVLPSGLTALLIWDGIEVCAVSNEGWARTIQKCTALRYFHVLAEHDRGADMSAELLEHYPPSLELFGFNSTLRSVVSTLRLQRDRVRASADVRVHSYSAPWPLAKLWFRTAEDFGDPDWEWLLRGHHASLFNFSHVIA